MIIQFREVTLCLVIKIDLRQKKWHSTRYHFKNRSLLPPFWDSSCNHCVFYSSETLHFTNTKDLRKGSNSALYSKVYHLEFLIKFIWINIGETYRDLKVSFSILRIYKDSQFNNTKTKILKHKYKTRHKPWGNLLRFSARPEDVEKT